MQKKFMIYIGEFRVNASGRPRHNLIISIREQTAEENILK
jgi:hypothetical protein